MARSLIHKSGVVRMFINWRLPGMNEIVASAKIGGKGGAYAKLKANQTNAIALLAQAQGVPRFASPVHIDFEWREPDRRRDPDNVCGGGRKFALDGLVAAGVLADDGWDEVASWTDKFVIDDECGVLLTIREANDPITDNR